MHVLEFVYFSPSLFTYVPCKYTKPSNPSCFCLPTHHISKQNQEHFPDFVYISTPKVNKTKNTPPTLFTSPRLCLPTHHISKQNQEHSPEFVYLSTPKVNKTKNPLLLLFINTPNKRTMLL